MIPVPSGNLSSVFLQRDGFSVRGTGSTLISAVGAQRFYDERLFPAGRLTPDALGREEAGLPLAGSSIDLARLQRGTIAPASDAKDVLGLERVISAPVPA